MMDGIVPGPCLVCHKGGVTKVCGPCRSQGLVARYCSRPCQRSDWGEHKKHCQKTQQTPRPMARSTHKFDDVQNGKPTSQGGNAGLHWVLSEKPWWDGLSVERQHGRFVMSYQFRNEDPYMFRAEHHGPYNPGSDVHAGFRKYHRNAARNGLLPNSCKGAFVNSAYAKKNCRYAIEKSDISEKFGYGAMEHMVLRVMAEELTGQTTTGGPVGLAEQIRKDFGSPEFKEQGKFLGFVSVNN